MTPAWQLQNPIDAVVFDCDGTLSTIEGIDELATNCVAKDVVKKLTADAMGKTGINPEIYQQRLELVKPTKEQIYTLGKKYFDYQVPDAAEVIRIFQRLNKSVYLVSAGLLPSVNLFGNKLNIPASNIFAVDIQFDTAGNYLNFDRESPLAKNNGKKDILNQLKLQHKEIIYIGDGLNDLVVIDLVNRFIGFGGSFYRKNIAERCQFYITTLSMAALLPLSITQYEFEVLAPNEKKLYQKGLEAIEKKNVIIQN